MKKTHYKLLSQLFLAVLFLGACSSNDGGPEDPVQINSDCLKIGDYHQGGIIFYLDATNEHGLIAAMHDQSNAAIWGCPEISEPIAAQRDIGFGNINTLEIVNNCSEENTAAKICTQFNVDGYDDWFLPTVHELELLYHHRDLVGGFAATNYSSSSEIPRNSDRLYIYVLTIDFGSNPVEASRQEKILKTTPLPVRAIREF